MWNGECILCWVECVFFIYFREYRNVYRNREFVIIIIVYIVSGGCMVLFIFDWIVRKCGLFGNGFGLDCYYVFDMCYFKILGKNYVVFVCRWYLDMFV